MERGGTPVSKNQNHRGCKRVRPPAPDLLPRTRAGEVPFQPDTTSHWAAPLQGAHWPAPPGPSLVPCRAAPQSTERPRQWPARWPEAPRSPGLPLPKSVPWCTTSKGCVTNRHPETTPMYYPSCGSEVLHVATGSLLEVSPGCHQSVGQDCGPVGGWQTSSGLCLLAAFSSLRLHNGGPLSGGLLSEGPHPQLLQAARHPLPRGPFTAWPRAPQGHQGDHSLPL